MKKITSLIIIALCTTGMFGQRLLGTVTDAKTNEPIIGVNVFIKSIKKGVTTKNNGVFYFEQIKGLEPKDTLLFNMVGYQTLKLTLAQFEKREKKVALIEENFSRIRNSGKTTRIISIGATESRK